MCGIFGFSIQKNNTGFEEFEKSTKLLFKISQLRGQDSSGISMLCDKEILTYKAVMSPSSMIKQPQFAEVIQSGFAQSSDRLTMIGHCRLVTNGSFSDNNNNHPIETSRFIGIHNGIILNADTMAGVDTKNSMTREHLFSYSDTQLFFSKIDKNIKEFKDIKYAIGEAFNVISGSASIALIDKQLKNLLLATNTGSLYYLFEQGTNNFVFASEKQFLIRFVQKGQLINQSYSIDQLNPGECLEVGKANKDLVQMKQIKPKTSVPQNSEMLPNILLKSDVSKLKRCARCILPETYPFITFDEKGVCNFCNKFQRQKYYGKPKLEAYLDSYRSKDGSVDCLVGLSGGRDSSWGIHKLKTEYGMTPIAYTYDWGLTTDTARRNQAKVCGKLGLEHIIRAANIQQKRRYIRKNIYAWLKNPQLGMVPLFMAGDKDFYQLGRTLRNDLNLNLTIFCSGHLIEQREFFVGFCGVNQNVTNTARTYHYSFFAKSQLAFYYIKQYLRNPFYINESFLDSIRSFFTTFLFRDDFLYLFEYLPWEEKKIEDLLVKEYDWEIDESYGKNQWRMGDGQTAFTNYIYYTLAGFSEYDNFRSNQIREELLTREEAMKLIEYDNQPKIKMLEYFSYIVGFNLDEVLARINSIPQLY